MKTVYFLLALGLFGSIGCTGLERNPAEPVKVTAAGKSPTDVPLELRKLLPKEHLSEKNAHAQARLLEETLIREGGRNDRADAGRE